MCMALGVVCAIIEKIWGGIESLLSFLLSFFIPGLGLGILFFLVMGAGWIFGIFGDINIFGIHSFILGFVAGTLWEFFLCIKGVLFR